VQEVTALYLLRTRYLVSQGEGPAMLSEEILVLGKEGSRQEGWLPDEQTLKLLGEATPSANIPRVEKEELVAAALTEYEALSDSIATRLDIRAEELNQSHRRVRRAVRLHVRGFSVEPQNPPDLIGVLVLQPAVGS